MCFVTLCIDHTRETVSLYAIDVKKKMNLTCINKHAADRLTKFIVSLYFYFNFGCKLENVICCGNEYG